MSVTTNIPNTLKMNIFVKFIARKIKNPINRSGIKICHSLIANNNNKNPVIIKSPVTIQCKFAKINLTIAKNAIIAKNTIIEPPFSW